MSRYVCMLRGVNVGGKRRLSMADLRRICEDLGYSEVETYLQSGNVVLTTEAASKLVTDTLAAAIKSEIGHPDVSVLLRTEKELGVLLESSPFVERGCDPTKLHLTFFDGEPDAEATAAIETERYLPDEFAFGPGAVHVHCPNGYRRTKLNNNFFEKKLGVDCTTRNWKTANALYQLGRQ